MSHFRYITQQPPIREDVSYLGPSPALSPVIEDFFEVTSLHCLLLKHAAIKCSNLYVTR
ncbi:uncharacterized, partial [Tachysurus ichikawai]